MQILLAIQARSNSTRLPGKIYLPFGESTVLEHLYKSMKKVEGVDVKVLGHANDPELSKFCIDKNLSAIFAAEEDNLLDRYHRACEPYDAVIRVTSDCPIIPRSWVESVRNTLNNSIDYVTNVAPRLVPDGHDCQGISKKALDWYFNEMKTEEHLFFELENNHHFKKKFTDLFTFTSLITAEKIIVNPLHPECKLSIDTQGDYERLKQMV